MAADNFLRLRLLIAKYVRIAVKDQRFGIAKLTAVASELGMSTDEFNNLIYQGRVDLNESYVTSVFELLANTCPDYASSLLSEWLLIQGIHIGNTLTSELTGDDVKTIFLKAIREQGELAGTLADAEADGVFDLGEIASSLRQVRILKNLISNMEADLLHRQADAIQSGTPRKFRRNGATA